MEYKVYRELPILFKGEMVRRIIANKKHKTRRLKAPWNVGDYLWVREQFNYVEGDGTPSDFGIHYYATDTINWWVDHECWMNYPINPKKMPSIFMPKWASRITLEVTEKYQERLQDITDYECLEEGIEYREEDGSDIRDNFAKLWNSINAKPKPVLENKKISHYVSYPWEDIQETRIYRGKEWFVIGNPIVWVTGFKVLDIKGI
jgi:hypothetical protein